jgi:hypothetical protein
MAEKISDSQSSEAITEEQRRWLRLADERRGIYSGIENDSAGQNGVLQPGANIISNPDMDSKNNLKKPVPPKGSTG